MHAILCDIPSNFVSLTDNMAAFDATAGEPKAEGVWMMVAAGNRLRARAVAKIRFSPYFRN
jgi:hypothetical protein